MIDSTNPRIMATNIRELAAASGGRTNVVANPEGTATVNLVKLKVGKTIYGIPGSGAVNYSTNEFDTGEKWIDGSIIYGKVYTPASAIQLSTQGMGTDITSAITNVSDISLIIGASAHQEETSLYLPIAVDISNGTITAYTFVNATVDVIVLKYIKAAPANSTKRTSKK